MRSPIRYIAAIASSVKTKKSEELLKRPDRNSAEDVSKDEFYKRIESGMCGMCGKKNSDDGSICDECKQS